jgi:hypothetical protein
MSVETEQVGVGIGRGGIETFAGATGMLKDVSHWRF